MKFFGRRVGDEYQMKTVIMISGTYNAIMFGLFTSDGCVMILKTLIYVGFSCRIKSLINYVIGIWSYALSLNIVSMSRQFHNVCRFNQFNTKI